MKNLLALFFKAHVDTYTRKDGSVVEAHDDKRAPAKDWRDEENWHSRTMGKFKTYSDEQLRFVIKDATEAAEIGEKSGRDSKKTGQYRDEAHYAGMELKKRQGAGKSGSKSEAAPLKKFSYLGIHDKGHGSPFSTEGHVNARDEAHAHELATGAMHETERSSLKKLNLRQVD